MNIYSKLAEARVTLQEADIKKSGENKHLKFKYSELQDFIPSINMINKNIGLLSVFNIVEDTATLEIFNTDKENESITFTSPTAKAKLQGAAAPIQELGSMHTYMRRYMYMLAYEITESDSVDADLGRQVTPEEKKEIEADKKAEQKKLVDAREGLKTFITSVGKDIIKVEEYFKCKIDNMKLDEVETVFNAVEKSADKK